MTHDDGPPEAHGKVIRFPREWVPPEGIEPLDHADPEPDEANSATSRVALGAAPNSRSQPLERDFWASGDTQEFVSLVDPSQSPSAAPEQTFTAADGALDPTHSPIAGTGDGAMQRRFAAAGRRSTERRVLSRAAGMAAVTSVLVAGGVLALVDTHHQATKSAPRVALGALLEPTTADRAGHLTRSANVTAGLTGEHARQRAGARRPAHPRRTATRHANSASSVDVHYTPPASAPAQSVAAATPQSASQTSGASTATAAAQPASSQPAGPSGFGHVVGTNCNPQCH